MAFNSFIPQVWSARILENLHKEMVYSTLFNRDYEGEILEAGDTVHIGQIGTVSIKDYTRNTAIDDPEAVQAEDKTLVIDQSDYFNIAIDDLDKVQGAADLLEAAAQEAGYGFADKADAYLASLLAANAGTTIGTKDAPEAITKDTAYELVTKLKLALDKANAPKQGRKCVVPAEFEAAMLLDPRFVAVGTEASNARLENGMIYRAAGFEIAVSNNAPVNGKVYDVIATCDRQGTFAEQVTKVEPYRVEKGFSDAVKGLHLYGAKVLRPEIVATAKVSF